MGEKVKSRKKGIMAMIGTIVVWGISFISIEVGLRAFQPMSLGLIRFIFATALVYVICKLTRTDLTLHKKDYKYIGIAGSIGITAYFYFENVGIQYTNASVASLIIAAIPVFSFLADMIVYKNKWRLETLASLACSIVGVVFIVGIDLKALLASGYLLGYIMMFISVLMWIVYSLATKPLFKNYPPMAITFYQFVVGTICFIPFSFFEKNNLSAMNTEVVLHVLFLGIFASAIGFYLYLIGLNELGITASSLYLNLIPVITVICSYFYLGQRISLMQAIGGVFVVMSVCLVNRQSASTDVITSPE